jgi:hypothetical protein
MKGSDCLGNYTFDHGHWEIWRDKYQYDNKGLCREKNDITEHVDKGKLIKSILKASVDTIFSLTHCILHICLILLFRVNYAFQICENSEFGNLFEINSKIVYGPSITPKRWLFCKKLH